MSKSLPASRVRPIIRSLSGDESAALLVRNQVGRIAYSLHDRVDMEPIHFVYEAPWIYGRTSVGAKLLTLARNQWCAFECDEVHGLFDWQSVVVKGPFSTQGSRFAGWDVDRAVAALRRLVPGALTADDPTPHRDIVFGIHASEISGKGSVSSPRRIPVPLAVPAPTPLVASAGMARLTRLTLL
jgi:nitroimidazol reductase NimA-like FMN-containing flavoprotein (pyridoxamine 5'-phosphate oxidase superfamily)